GVPSALCPGSLFLMIVSSGSAGDDAMEMELDFPSDNAAYSLDQTTRLVVLLSQANHIIQPSARRHGERGLVDDLISRVQFRNDEVTRGAIGQHARRKRFV